MKGWFEIAVSALELFDFAVFMFLFMVYGSLLMIGVGI